MTADADYFFSALLFVPSIMIGLFGYVCFGVISVAVSFFMAALPPTLAALTPYLSGNVDGFGPSGMIGVFSGLAAGAMAAKTSLSSPSFALRSQGSFLGFLAGTFICGFFVPQMDIPQEKASWVTFCVMGVFTVGGGFLATKVEKFLKKLSPAALGSYMFCNCLTGFVGGGSISPFSFATGGFGASSPGTIAVLALWVLLFLSFLKFQFSYAEKLAERQPFKFVVGILSKLEEKLMKKKEDGNKDGKKEDSEKKKNFAKILKTVAKVLKDKIDPEMVKEKLKALHEKFKNRNKVADSSTTPEGSEKEKDKSGGENENSPPDVEKGEEPKKVWNEGEDSKKKDSNEQQPSDQKTPPPPSDSNSENQKENENENEKEAPPEKDGGGGSGDEPKEGNSQDETQEAQEPPPANETEASGDPPQGDNEAAKKPKFVPRGVNGAAPKRQAKPGKRPSKKQLTAAEEESGQGDGEE